MRVTSTVDTYLALAEVDDDRRLAAWIDEYEAAHAEVFDSYYSGFSSPDQRAASATDVPRLAPLVRGLERRALDLVQRTELAYRREGHLDDELDVVLLVGHHSSNGWVTEFDGRPTLFLALEYLGRRPLDAVLVAHEVLHVAHARRAARGWPEDLATRIFQEGLAVAVSRDHVPGLSESAYTWFDDDHQHWTAQCSESASRLGELVRAGLDLKEDDARVSWLVKMRPAQSGLPSRSGYWVGDLIARRLLEQHDLGELLDWDHATARSALARMLPG